MAKTQLKNITTRGNLKPVRLAGSYAAGEVELCVIHAYNAVDAERKERFHRDASRFLHSVGACLRQLAGFTQMSCHSSKGGIAVGGEVYATYVHPERRGRLDVAIESDGFWEGSPREDRLVIRVEWIEQEDERSQEGDQGQLASEQGSTFKRKSGRGKGITLTAYRHTVPVHAPRSRLNPNYDSEVTARCLLLVLKADRAAEYWEWLPDGSRISAEQAEVERAERRQARERARKERGQWGPIAEDPAAENCQLQENYLAAISSRLLFADATQPGTSSSGLEQPRMSRGGEETFLQRDFARDAHAFLRALGSCLRDAGYGEMRVEEPERLMLVFAEYRKAEQRQVLRVNLGSVRNTDVAQRHDHLVIAAFLAPDGVAEGSEGEHCIGLGVPIRLSAAAYARQLLSALAVSAVAPDEQTPAALAPTARKGRQAAGEKHERRTCRGRSGTGALVLTFPLHRFYCASHPHRREGHFHSTLAKGSFPCQQQTRSFPR